MYLIIVVLITSVPMKCMAEWKLVFNDDFNDRNTIDTQKWDIENEEISCNGNGLEQLHCKTNSEHNIRIFNETLVLAAIRQKYLTKDYTSALIKVKQAFTYGRIEIRAALPKGKMLRPAFHLLPVQGNEEWPRSGEVVMMVYEQSDWTYQGIHYRWPTDDKYKSDFNDYKTNKNLNDFHTYSMEWLPNQFSWELDGQLLKSADTSSFNDTYQPFTKPFKLVISLGVGGQYSFSGQTLSFNDADDWECSLLIIDFVRIYQQMEQDAKVIITRDEREKSRNEICNQITPLIRQTNKSSLIMNRSEEPSKESGVSITTIISVSCLLLLIAFIGLVVFLFIKFKALNSQITSVSIHKDLDNHYDDINYDEVNYNQEQNNVYLEVM